MTSNTLSATSTPAAADRGSAEDRAPRPVLPVLGGLASVVAPLLFVAGAATSPPQASGSTEDYIASLAEDPTLTAISANLFHYSWVLFAFAALASIGLVRGRRGRALTTVGAVAGAFGAIQFTGLLLNDWFFQAIGNELPMDQALEVAAASGDASTVAWMMTAKICGLLGFPLLYAGLARAGVISWWLVPMSLLPMVAFGVVGGPLGIVAAAVLYAPSYVVGWRLVQRARVAR
jgi:hypothetical protein